MHILVIKTSSMGDVIHMLPALSDAVAHVPGLEVDWAVEPAYGEICRWHPAVRRTVPVPYREWRAMPWSFGRLRAFHAMWRRLAERRYDRVIDAQGLLKSALIGLLTRGPRHGLNMDCVSEWPAALTYHRRHAVPQPVTAVERCRRLFAAALGYEPPQTAADFGLARAAFGPPPLAGRYLVFGHGTAWPTKNWTIDRWLDLANLAANAGYRICLPWHDATDRDRAETIAAAQPAAVAIRLDIAGVARALAHADGMVGVETAFSHLAAALGVPTVTLFGPTGPALHGAVGPRVHNLAPTAFACSPCYGRAQCRQQPAASAAPPCVASLTAAQAWDALGELTDHGKLRHVGVGE